MIARMVAEFITYTVIMGSLNEPILSFQKKVVANNPRNYYVDVEARYII